MRLLDALNESWELASELPEVGYRKKEIVSTSVWDSAVGKQNLPAAPAEYSPFDDWDSNQKVLEIIFAYDHLWAATNRGLVRYEPASQKWELFDTKKGLVSNEIPAKGFVVSKGRVWVATHWGGLSGIPY